jgi:HEAT repeat protein
MRALPRLAQALKIQAGEGRTAALLISLMLASAAGSSVGGNGIEALFFARFGVGWLPYLYMGLGLLNLVTTLAVTALLGRLARERLYVALPLVLAAVLLVQRALLALDLPLLYPAMWLGLNVMNALDGLLTWGLAGVVCDTRQAKRLFPLFGAGRILGAVAGGLSTRVLAGWLHAENLMLVWAAALIVAFVLGRALVAGRPPAPRARPVPLRAELQQGYQFVRRSALLRWVAGAAVLFSVLYFSIALPFSRAATAQFPDADALAGFLGTFQGVSTAAAFLASLFLANRLFARFGIMSMLLGFTLIYLGGFAALVAAATFPAIVAFRFLQMAWLSGIADPAYQALFNVVPPERRDQTRAFIDGVPGQAGTIIAGLILVVGEQALEPRQLYTVGLVAAGVTTFLIWQARRAYGGALGAALRAGQPQVFFDVEAPFGGFRHDAGAVQVAVGGLADPDPALRRVSVEILGNLPVPAATDALVGALDDADAAVRAAALRALARAQATPALLAIAARLRDPEAEVRLQAVAALARLAGYPQGLRAQIEPLLADGEPAVRAQAALALARWGGAGEARAALEQMARAERAGDRAQALAALGTLGAPESFALVAAGLDDPAPTVRRAAAAALIALEPAAGIARLVRALGDEDRSVRSAVARALGRAGPAALAPVVAALREPPCEDGALQALCGLAVAPAARALRDYGRAKLARALELHGLARAFEPAEMANGRTAPGHAGDAPADQTPAAGQSAGQPRDGSAGDERAALLADALETAARREARRALRAVALLGDRAALLLAVDSLDSRDPRQRANALETLDASGEPEIVRPLLRIWEPGAAPPPAEGRLLDVLADRDGWLRACAALAARGSADGTVRAALAQLAESDPDAFVRATAAWALNGHDGDETMETLPTLSPMERILFLRRVPLFADLTPADLKQVADIAAERLFMDGEAIARQGDPGDEMYIIVAGEVSVRASAPAGVTAAVPAGGSPGPAAAAAAVREVARRRTGDVVGEMAIISQEPRIASLVALGEVRVLAIGQRQFEGILRERPEMSLGLIRVLCMRLREIQNVPPQPVAPPAAQPSAQPAAGPAA